MFRFFYRLIKGDKIHLVLFTGTCSQLYARTWQMFVFVLDKDKR